MPEEGRIVGVGREAKFLKEGEFGTTQEGSSKVRYHRLCNFLLC